MYTVHTYIRALFQHPKPLTMNSSSPSLKPDVTLSLTLPSSTPPTDTLRPEERGIKLIQLLLTCANHASSGNIHRADACLRRISHLADINGDSMQRLAARFAAALAVRLVKRWPGLYKALNQSGPSNDKPHHALSIFTQAFPYLGFSYSVITETLIKCLRSERVIHIIDLGSGDPNLYIPLLQKLSCEPNGAVHMKITCVSANKAQLDELGCTLVKVADSLNMPFQYNPVHVSLRELTKDMLDVRLGEALAFISILNLHVLLAEDDRVDAQFGVSKKNESIKDCIRMGDFLAMIRSMSPKVTFIVEQESDHNLTRLVDRFVEGLHYYSAVFDSIDSTFGTSNPEDRIALEEMFGNEIENIVACEGMERKERHERSARWMVRFGRVGFKPVNLWCTEDANGLVEAYRPVGYKTVSQKTSLLICWHDRPIYAISAWTCLNF